MNAESWNNNLSDKYCAQDVDDTYDVAPFLSFHKHNISEYSNVFHGMHRRVIFILIFVYV